MWNSIVVSGQEPFGFLEKSFAKRENAWLLERSMSNSGCERTDNDDVDFSCLRYNFI